MLTCPSVSTVPTHRLLSILLLVVSLNAQNESWDSPICTKDAVSVPRGSRAVLTCNISNTFTDVTIQLKAHGQDKTIFNKKVQGHFSQSGWELQVQGGQAQLVIKDAQDVHTGVYLWQLHGRQRYYRNITLNVSEPSNKEEVTDMRLVTPSDPPMSSKLEARPTTLLGVMITVFLILGLLGISAFFCYRHHRS